MRDSRVSTPVFGLVPGEGEGEREGEGEGEREGEGEGEREGRALGQSWKRRLCLSEPRA